MVEKTFFFFFEADLEILGSCCEESPSICRSFFCLNVRNILPQFWVF